MESYIEQLCRHSAWADDEYWNSIEAHLGWLALIEGEYVVSGAGLWLMDWPAHMVGSGAKRGNILNVYTEPAFRRCGLADCSSKPLCIGAR